MAGDRLDQRRRTHVGRGCAEHQHRAAMSRAPQASVKARGRRHLAQASERSADRMDADNLRSQSDAVDLDEAHAASLIGRQLPPLGRRS